MVDTFKEGLSVQHILAREGHLNLLKRVLRDPKAKRLPSIYWHGHEPRAAYVIDGSRQSLLHLSAEGGQTEVFFYLYNMFFRNAHYFIKFIFDNMKNSVVHSASKVGEMCFLQRLHNSTIYPELFQMLNCHNECILFAAVHPLDANFLILIIEGFKLDVTRRNSEGNTVLHILASFAADNPSCWYVIEKLVERYPEHLLLDIPNEKGLTVRGLISDAGGAAIFSEQLLTMKKLILE